MDWSNLNSGDLRGDISTLKPKKKAFSNNVFPNSPSLIVIILFLLVFLSCIIAVLIISNTITVITSQSVSLTNDKDIINTHIDELTKNISKMIDSINKLQSIQSIRGAQIDNYIMLSHDYLQQSKRKLSHLNDLSKQFTQQKDNLIALNRLIMPSEDRLKGSELLLQEKKNIMTNLQMIYTTKLGLNSKDKQFDSVLITSDAKFHLLSFWISEGSTIKPQLLYRGSQSSFSIEDYHVVADRMEIKNTLLLIQMDNGTVVGGFTYNNWAQQGFQEDNYAFVFNLTTEKHYRVIAGLEAIYTFNGYFGIFGRGDLAIYSKGKVTSSFPSNYGKNVEELGLTNGKREFSIRELELFTITNI